MQRVNTSMRGIVTSHEESEQDKTKWKNNYTIYNLQRTNVFAI